MVIIPNLINFIKKVPIIILTILVFSQYCYASGKYIRIESYDTRETLPFSIIEFDNGRFLSTDSTGIIDISKIALETEYVIIKSFNHERKKIMINEIPYSDTLIVKLKPTTVTLSEISVTPLIKDKDIVIGKASLAKSYPDFHITKRKEYTPHEKWYEVGVKINTKKKKLNMLKAFGVNCVPSDTMPENFIFRISIYDVSGNKPTFPQNIPEPICEPIYILMEKSMVTADGFRYELPDYVRLPEKAVILVDWPYEQYMDSNMSIDMVSTASGGWFLYGNPYFQTLKTIWGFKYTLSPFFWEYTQYQLP